MLWNKVNDFDAVTSTHGRLRLRQQVSQRKDLFVKESDGGIQEARLRSVSRQRLVLNLKDEIWKELCIFINSNLRVSIDSLGTH